MMVMMIKVLDDGQRCEIGEWLKKRCGITTLERWRGGGNLIEAYKIIMEMSQCNGRGSLNWPQTRRRLRPQILII